MRRTTRGAAQRFRRPRRGPHLTEDLTYALAGRHRAAGDPRAGSTCGRASASCGHRPVRLGPQRHPRDRPDRGHRPDASTPSPGPRPRSSCRCWSSRSWRRNGVHAQVDYQRGVPPVVNDVESIVAPAHAGREVLGVAGTSPPSRAWAGGLRLVPRPGRGRDGPARHAHPGRPTYDLHQGNLRVDERAVAIGAKVLAHVAAAASASTR